MTKQLSDYLFYSENNPSVKLYTGHVLDILKLMSDESVDCAVTSPPYWSLRSYKSEPQIWDADPNCQHEWDAKIVKHDNFRFRAGQNTTIGNFKNPYIYTNNKIKQNFCIKCNAWQGELGAEPDFHLYLKHLISIFKEVKRITKPYGSIWVNLGDTFSGSLCGYGAKQSSMTGFQKAPTEVGFYGSSSDKPPTMNCELPNTCLCQIPSRFSIMMTDELSLILRNIICWHKPNAMPQSTSNRFSVDYEFIFWFVKSNKPLFWVNEKILKSIKKKPLGINGIENDDWEYMQCLICQGTGKIEQSGQTKILQEITETISSPRAKYRHYDGTCAKCKGTVDTLLNKFRRFSYLTKPEGSFTKALPEPRS